MKEVVFGRVFMLAIIILLPCTVSAQGGTMSFSEEEVESADGEKEESSEDGESEEDEETTEDDVLSALGETSLEGGGDDVSVGPEEGAAREPHPIWAVQRIYALRARRVDLQPSFGVSLNDPYMQHQSINLSASYYITEVLAVGVSFNFYRWLEAERKLNFRLSRATHQRVPINEYFWGGQLNFTYVPMYGKFAMFKEWILHWDVWVIGGGGFIFTRPRPKIDPEYRDFDFTMKFCFNVGIGGRLFLSRFLAIYVELRDYIYPEELESLETSSNEEWRRDDSNWLDDDYKLTNNVTLHVGVSLFIPFVFEYKLPK